MTASFDRFVAADWSGAKGGSYGGIAVAECRRGDEAPLLVPSESRRWSRSQFVAWIIESLPTSGRTLVGIDCAFALPAATGSALLGDNYSAFELWQYIDDITTAQADFCAVDFVTHPDHQRLYWRSGKRPDGFLEHRRATETACADKKLGNPQSTLKLIGAKQVGKASLAGMRVLLELRRRLGMDLAIWPFENIASAKVVCVEIYPRLFLKKAGQGNAKAAASELDARLANLGSRPFRRTQSLTDHDTDALISAAGLREFIAQGRRWGPDGLDSLAARAEGWIFGVT